MLKFIVKAVLPDGQRINWTFEYPDVATNDEVKGFAGEAAIDYRAWIIDSLSGAAVNAPKVTRAELAQRRRFIQSGMWDDAILVFDDREIHTTSVRMHGTGAFMVGKDTVTKAPVEGKFDPADVKRVFR